MLKVFLVEDEIVIREGIQEMVPWEDYGFELSGEAADGEIALPLIREIRPDVVITDIKMPFMDGLSLSAVIKKEMPQTKIVIISGYDDFSYAQKAISVGVERYLLKPVSKNAFVEVLQDIRNKYESENALKTYYEKFKSEMQEYEKNSRRDFFENLVSGKMAFQEIYERADKLKIDLLAESYNFILFSLNEKFDEDGVTETYSQGLADMQNVLNDYFTIHTEYLLFRNQMFSYAVLIKGKREETTETTKKAMEELNQLFAKYAKSVEWFICCGKTVERLSQISKCYKSAMQIFSCRYMYDTNIVNGNMNQDLRINKEEKMDLKVINPNAMNPQIMQNFMSNGLKDEVDQFVESYFSMFKEETLCSKMFRQYILLNIYFCAVDFIQKFGMDKDELEEHSSIVTFDGQTKDVLDTVKNMLTHVIDLRDENARNCYKSVIRKAVLFIEKNYMNENLSLNMAAQSVNVSANHFSALFSQEMEKTFIEYVTDLRMKKAKELLRCSDKRSGEIALEIGYKDSHYFSFLFKKTQGCTPSEYRNRGGENEKK